MPLKLFRQKGDRILLHAEEQVDSLTEIEKFQIFKRMKSLQP